MRPKGQLVERNAIKNHTHFDTAPYSNMKLLDVARVLDMETARPRINPSIIAKLVDRILAGVGHTIIAMQGRPEGTRLVGILNRSFNRILDQMPEFGMDESFASLHGDLAVLND
jgi:hypothetical protein